MVFVMTLQEYLQKKREIMEMEEPKYESREEMLKRLNDLYYGQLLPRTPELKQKNR